MAGRESAGSVFVTIDGDASPLLAKYQQAEAQSRAAGQRIASGLGDGLGSAKRIVDQFGNAISSGIVTPVAAADSEIKKLTVAVIALTESLDSKGTPALRRMGQAAHGTVSEIQATSGALRVLEGNGGLRAAERFIATTIGIGGALQTIFPIVGAIAFGELLEKTAGRFFGVSEAEKKAAEDAKTVSGEIKNLDHQVEALQVRFETMRNGAQAGLNAELGLITAQFTEAAAAYETARQKLRGGKEETIGGKSYLLPVHGASIQRTPEAAAAEKASLEVEKVQAEGLVKLEELRKKKEEEAKAAAAKQKAAMAQARTDLKDSYDNQLADLKSAHEVTRAEELKFRQDELNDVRSRGNGFAPLATEVNRQVGTLSQEVRKEDVAGSSALAMAQVEYASRLRKEAIAGLEADGRLMTAATEVITKEMDREAAARKASADIADRSGKQGRQYLDVAASGSGEADKLRLEIIYQGQIVHSKQQELDYARQLFDIEAATLQKKLQAADADVADARAALLMNPTADQLFKLQQAITVQKQAQNSVDNNSLQTQSKLQAQVRQNSLAGQIQGAVGKGPGSILDARNLVIATTMGTAVDGIASALGRAAQGGQKLGQIFTQLGRSILGQVVSQIAKIGLQMATTALLGKAVGSAIAVAEVTSAAAVGAANAAASTAAIPIVGPALAPAAAAATFAEIMAFASLASYDKGGMIPEDMVAMVHKGEFVLTADQVAGRSALPSLPASGGLGSSGLTTASAISNSSSQNQSNVFHLHGVRNVEDFARRLPSVLKSRAPVFSPATR